MTRPKLYLAGPISIGSWAVNDERFQTAHDALMEAGFAVFNPGLTMHLGCAEDYTHEDWLECCLPWVREADLLVRLPGESRGADREVEEALACGVQVFGDEWIAGLDDLKIGSETPPVLEAISCLNSGLLWCQGQWSCPPAHRHRYPAFAENKKPCSGCSKGGAPGGSPAPVEPSLLLSEHRMTQGMLIELHEYLCGKAREVMKAKNDDYANPEAGNSPFANFNASEVMGIHPVKGLLLRTLDKLKRIQSYIDRGDLKVADEGWQDACLDVLNYMILCYGMLLEADNKWGSSDRRVEDHG